MKYPFILLSLLAVLMISCEEKLPLNVVTESPSFAETTVLSSYSLLDVVDDAEDEFLNHAMLLSVRALRRAVLSNPTAFRNAENAANAKHLAVGMKLSQFLSFDSELKSSFLSFLEKEVAFSPESLKKLFVDGELFPNLEDVLTYKGVEYDLAIHSFARKYPETNKSISDEYIFAVGETVTDEDEVLAYQGSNSEPMFLSEEEAKISPVPIYVIDFGTDSDLNNAYLVPNSFDDSNITPSLVANKMVGEKTVLKNWRIRRRMENDKTTEYRAAALAHPNNLANTQAFAANLYEENQKRSDIGNLTPANAVLIDWDNVEFSSSLGFPATSGSITDRYFVFAWERDWINSAKIIANQCATSANLFSHSVTTNRKHAEDVYYKECGVKNIDFPSNNFLIDFGNFEDEVWEIRREN